MADAPRHTPPSDLPDTPANESDTPPEATAPPAAVGDGAPESTGTPARPRRRWPRRVLRGVLALFVLLFVAVAALLLLIRTEYGRARIQSIAVAEIDRLFADDAVVRVRRLDGNFLTGARMVGFVVEREGQPVLSVDTLFVNYNLLTLVGRTFSADSIVVVNPTLIVRQRANGAFDVADLLKPADTTKTDSTGSNFRVQVGAFALRGGRAEVHFYNPRRDSVLVAEAITGRATDFTSGPDGVAGRLNGLRAQVTAPNEAARLALAGAGAFTNRALTLETLRLTSAAGTEVAGRAHYVFADSARHALPALDADLRAAPLALADVRALTGLELYGAPRLNLTARSGHDPLTGRDLLSINLRGALDGASLSLDGALQGAHGGGGRRIRATGTLNRLNPATLTRNPALDADLNARFELDFEGDEPERFDGPFRLELTQSRVGGRPIERAQLAGDLTDGRLAFDLDAAVPGARVVATGTARPFDRVPTYEAEGRADNVDLAVLTGDPATVARFSGSFSVSGRGTDPRDLLVDARVDLDRGQFGTLTLAGAGATVHVRGQAVAFDAVAEFAGGGGSVAAVGTVRPFEDPLVWRVASGYAEGLDVAALTGDPTQTSDLTGTFSAEGTGIDPQTMTARAEVHLDPSRFGEFELVDLDLTASFAGGVVNFDGAADLGRAGSLRAEGTAWPFESVLRFHARGRADHLDLAELTGNPANASDLNGAFVASGRGTDVATLALDATLDLDPSSYGAQEVTAGRLTLNLDRGALALRGDLATPEGRFALDITGRPFDETPTFTFNEGMGFEGLDLAALTGNPSLRSRLNGSLTGRLTGTDPATASGSGSLVLGPSTFNDAAIQSGVADFTLERGDVEVTADLLFGPPEGAAEGRASFTFSGRPFDEVPTYTLNGALDSVDVAGLLGTEAEPPARVSLLFDVTGQGFDPKTMTLRAEAHGGGTQYGDVYVDTLDLALGVNAGVLDVDTLVVRSNLLEADGGGTINFAGVTREPTAFSLNAEVRETATLAGLVPQPVAMEEGELALTVRGNPGDSLHFDGAFRTERFAYGTMAVDSAGAHVTGRYDPATSAFSAAGEGRFSYLLINNRLIQEGDVAARFTGDSLAASGDVTLDYRRRAAFALRTDLDPAAPTVFLDDLRLDLDTTTWALARPAAIQMGEQVRVDSLRLVAGDDQEILLHGIVDPHGEQDFTLTAEGVQLSPVTDLLNFNGLGGRLTAALTLAGPAEAPTLDGTLQLADLTSQGEPVGTLDARVGYDDRQLNLDARLAHVRGGSLTTRGFVPLRFSLAHAGGEEGAAPALAVTEASAADQVRFVIQADSLPLSSVEPFLDRRAYNEVDGLLHTPDSIVVTGTQADPQLSGRAVLIGGRFGVVSTGMVYETIAGALTFEGNRVAFENLTIADPDDGEVALDVDGAITLPRLSVGELDLTVTPSGFVAIDTPTYRELILDPGDEPLRLTGTLTRPVLRGSVVLARGDIFLTDELLAPQLERVDLTLDDIRTLQARFGRRVTAADTAGTTFMDALDLHVNVEIGRDVWVRARSGVPFDIEFTGEIEAVKPPMDTTAGALPPPTQLYGNIELVRGSVETLGRRFTVRRGTLLFNGNPADALADVEATLDIRTDPQASTTAVQITLLFQGQLSNNPEIRLTSNPALDNADIVSLIATGRLSDDLFEGGGGGGLGGAAQGFALGQLTGLVEGVAENALGLDVIQITAGPEGIVIQLGKYLTSKAFVSVGYPLGERDDEGRPATPQIALDYEFVRWLLAQLQYRERGVGGGLLFQVAY
ncbi:MAG TPA: translocation/assembly module TamB domain-containing protein [Rubricoccaceae bacterium]|nr:translocation/assembly module TamB domain-containing protein [Rubricoccaceae bacterium]